MQCLRSARVLAPQKEVLMTRTLTASMRRMSRLLRPAEMTKTTRTFQNAMTNIMMGTAPAMVPATKSKLTKAGRKPGPPGITQLRPAQSLLPRAMAGSALSEASPRIPEGAQYLTRTHRSASGARGYKLYLPASHPERPKGLILMLHGCSQSPDDFAIGTRINALAEKHGFAIVYPAQTRRHNGASCWNWFKPGHQGRGAGEPAILASLTRKLMKKFGLYRDSVFVAGLSAGGSMAAILADVYPDVFSAAAIHSGLTRGSASNVISAMSAMRKGCVTMGIAPIVGKRSYPVRRIVFQGDADSTVHPSNAAKIVAAAMGVDAVPTRIGKRTVRGRGYSRSDFVGSDGAVMLELWMIEGSGHAWSGGHASGSYTDNKGPDASVQMFRFFRANPLPDG